MTPRATGSDGTLGSLTASRAPPLAPATDNPKGYWERRETFELNEEIMAALDRPWSDSRPISPETWDRRELDELKERAASLLVDLFEGQKLWGFKDPRTIRVFPF